MKTRTCAGLLALCVALSPAAVAEPSQEIRELLDELAEKTTSRPWEADFTLNMDMVMMGQTLDLEASGTVLHGGEDRARTSMNAKFEGMPGMPGGGAMDMRTLMVSDGTTMWMEMAMGPMNQVMKFDLAQLEQMQDNGGDVPGGGMTGFDPMSQIEMITEIFDFRVREKTADRITLEAEVTEEGLEDLMPEVPGDIDLDNLGTMLFVIDRKTGFPVEYRMENGEPNFSMKMSEPRFFDGDRVPDGTFDYTPPPGVQVLDVSTMMGG